MAWTGGPGRVDEGIVQRLLNILNNLRRTVAPIKHRRNSCSMVDKGEMPVADRRSNILAKEECCPFHFIHKERACSTG